MPATTRSTAARATTSSRAPTATTAPTAAPATTRSTAAPATTTSTAARATTTSSARRATTPIVDSTFGNDRRLYGGPGNDTIKGGRGSDLIKGGDGNDQLFGESGTENVTGGDGDDLIDGGAARDILAGNNGSDVIHGDSGDDTLEGGNGADQVDGGSGPDEIFGDDGADLLVGGPDADTIDAGGGDDTIRAADDSRDEVDCGEGNDTVYVEADAPTRDVLLNCETVTPVPPEGANDSDAASVISGTQLRDVLHGTPGDDSLFGKGGPDALFGAGGDDYVDGEYGNDELHGGPGNDTMAGRAGDDRIFGDAGDDHITGDRGFDHIAGGSGNDEIFGNLDPDTISGGPGDDRINVVRGDIDSVVRPGPRRRLRRPRRQGRRGLRGRAPLGCACAGQLLRSVEDPLQAEGELVVRQVGAVEDAGIEQGVQRGEAIGVGEPAQGVAVAAHRIVRGAGGVEEVRLHVAHGEHLVARIAAEHHTMDAFSASREGRIAHRVQRILEPGHRVGPQRRPDDRDVTAHGWARIAATVAHAQRDSPARQSSPGGPAGGDRPQPGVDHQGQQLLLGLDVAIKRHRGGPELGRHAIHRDRCQPLRVRRSRCRRR